MLEHDRDLSRIHVQKLGHLVEQSFLGSVGPLSSADWFKSHPLDIAESIDLDEMKTARFTTQYNAVNESTVVCW